MLTLKLAIRGLWRHKMRTIITLAAVVGGQFMFLIFLSVNDGAHDQMIEIGIRQGRCGHVVVQAEGYQESQAMELLVPDGHEIRDIVKRKNQELDVALRVFGGGLARTAAGSVGVFFAGVEPNQEKGVAEIPGRITRGVYLGANERTVRRAERKEGELWCAVDGGGGEASAVNVHPVVVGSRLADTLKLELCDRLVLDAQGMGSQESRQFRVVGVFNTGSADFDGSVIQILIQDAQQILHLGNGVHQVAVFGENARRTPSIIEDVKSAVGGRPGLVVLPWDEVITEMAELIWVDKLSGFVLMSIVLVIIGAGVLNTVLMSVMERTREFGVMRALGTRPRRVFWVVLTEGGFIGVLGVILGSIAVYPLLHYFSTTGIDLSSFSGGEPMEAGGVAITVVKGKIYPMSALLVSLGIFFMTILSSIYPAVRSVRMHILRALHHV